MKNKTERRLKMEQKYVLGIVALAMVAVLGVGMVSAQGFGMWNSDLTEEEKAEMQEQGEAIKTSIEDGNYAEWEGLMQERLAEMEDSINEDTFNQMQERHANMVQIKEAVEEAKETGNWSEVEALKDELGIKGKGLGKDHFGKKGFDRMGECLRLAK